jgi:NADH-quinone oxidoreductase subunit J
MNFFTVIFYLFALLAVGSATVVVFSKNIVHAAFALLFSLFAVAGLYVLLMADFLAVTQLLIYVGGILVLVLFGVMLTSRVISVDIKTGTIQTLPAVLLSAALAGMLTGMFWSTDWKISTTVRSPDATASELGNMLLSSYLLPFEIASVLLLVALMGAAMIARREKKR